MVVETEISHKGMQVFDLQYRRIAKSSSIQNLDEVKAISPPSSPVFHQIRRSADSELNLTTIVTSDTSPESTLLPYVPHIRSGSFANIGPRTFMEDEHICIDDLSSHLGPLFNFPIPSALYGVFDGHGGPDASAYIRRNAVRFFIEEADFPQSSQSDEIFLSEAKKSIQKAYLLLDEALGDDPTINSSSGTTALIAMILGRVLLVSNAGDCRAVLCRKGKAIDMSQDHRPSLQSELSRIEKSGGFVEDGYLNGVLSVSRALGDWDMKLPHDCISPLIVDPEFKQLTLTEDDEFLILGCDGIWDVMSSQHAVSIVRRGLRRHDNPGQSARELVMEALRLRTFDNVTIIIVCFSGPDQDLNGEKPRLKSCSLSTEALCTLQSFLDDVST